MLYFLAVLACGPPSEPTPSQIVDVVEGAAPPSAHPLAGPDAVLHVFDPKDHPAVLPHAVERIAFTGDRTSRPKNVVLVIGDGMGLAAVRAASAANRGSLFLDSFEAVGLQKTASASDWITDSAAAGTALATGTKALNGACGVGPDGNPVKSLTELAQARGLATGLVVTSEITHGTPAAFASHCANRRNAHEIADQMASANIDVLIGGGRSAFTERTDGRDLLAQMRGEGTGIYDGLDAIQGANSIPMAGFIHADKPPYRHEGRGQSLRIGTETALRLLSSDDDGFFLLVEASQIDWAAHSNLFPALVSETLDMDETVGSLLRFAAARNDTLIVVTADHETAGLTLVAGDTGLGTVTGHFVSHGHTGTMVPVFAWGPQAERFGGVYENTVIFDRILEAWDWGP